MRQFVYELYLAGHEAVTRSGIPVTDVVKFDVKSPYKLHGTVNGKVEKWKLDGTKHAYPHEKDLFILPKLEKRYAAYRYGDTTAQVHEDKAYLEKNFRHTQIIEFDVKVWTS